jgi:hypothetical protein
MVTLAALLRNNSAGKRIKFQAISVPPGSMKNSEESPKLAKCGSVFKVQHSLVVNNELTKWLE